MIDSPPDHQSLTGATKSAVENQDLMKQLDEWFDVLGNYTLLNAVQ